MEYKRLGDYIREVNVRNRELKVTKLVGLTIDKAFIPSVANVIGTDLSNYKVIRREQFACSLMQVSRDGKMPVAMFEEDEAIMSPAYPMFEVIDKTALLPQYLMMWFSRSEFDREASYYAVGGVRGSLTWEDFCNMTLPIPSITRQHEIISEYETLTNRIHLNEQMIQKLEATAQALYRKMFVDGIDKENLPDGWRMGTLGEVLSKYIRGPFGSSLKKEDMQENGIPVYEQQHIIENHREFRYYISNEKYMQLKRFSVQKDDLVISCSGTIGRIAQIRDNDPLGVINQALLILRVNKNVYSPTILRYFLGSKEGHEMLLEDAHGSAQVNIAKRENIEKIPIIIARKDFMEKLNEQLSVIDNTIFYRQQETEKLNELQSLLLAKMGRSTSGRLQGKNLKQ